MEPPITIIALYHEATIPGLVTQAILVLSSLSGMIVKSLGKDLCFVIHIGRVLFLQGISLSWFTMNTDLWRFTRLMCEDNFLVIIPGPVHSYLLEVLVLLILVFLTQKATDNIHEVRINYSIFPLAARSIRSGSGPMDL